MSHTGQGREVAAGRRLGTLCAGAAAALWLAALLGFGPDPHFTGTSRYLAGLMLLLSLGAVAAARARSGAAALLFGLFSFLPVGLYMLGAESWLRWIGVANLGYLLAAALLSIGARRRRRHHPRVES